MGPIIFGTLSEMSKTNRSGTCSWILGAFENMKIYGQDPQSLFPTHNDFQFTPIGISALHSRYLAATSCLWHSNAMASFTLPDRPLPLSMKVHQDGWWRRREEWWAEQYLYLLGIERWINDCMFVGMVDGGRNSYLQLGMRRRISPKYQRIKNNM